MRTAKKHPWNTSSKRVELIITLGYAAGEYRQKKRKPKDETVTYNKY